MVQCRYAVYATVLTTPGCVENDENIFIRMEDGWLEVGRHCEEGDTAFNIWAFWKQNKLVSRGEHTIFDTAHTLYSTVGKHIDSLKVIGARL